MSRGVTVIPRTILVTAYGVQRRLERFEAWVSDQFDSLSGSGNVFVWRPNEPAPEGNVYADFALLYADFEAAGTGARVIVYDTELGNDDIPARDGGAKYDFRNTTIIGMEGYPTFRFADGALVSQWPFVMQNLDIRTGSNAAVLDLNADAQVNDPHYFFDCTIEGNGATAPLWTTAGGGSVRDVIVVNHNRNTNHIISDNFLNTTDTGSFRLTVFGMNVDNTAFTGDMNGGTLIIRADSGSRIEQQTDVAWTAGDVTVRYTDLAPWDVQRAFVTIPAGDVATLNATPYTVLSGPNGFFEIVRVHAWLDFETTAYDDVNAGENLVLRYTNGAGTILTEEIPGVGFGDAIADAHRIVGPVNTVITPDVGAAVVAHLLVGEWYAAAGDSPLKLEILYRDRTFNPTL